MGNSYLDMSVNKTGEKALLLRGIACFLHQPCTQHCVCNIWFADETAAEFLHNNCDLMKAPFASAELLSNSEKVVARSRNASAAGSQAVQRTIAQMNLIHEVVQSSAREVTELGTRSKAIGKVVDVITHIADQTNLLALNAAIEAARAGEYGRGFAVVAEEVKKLADGSAEAANQIGVMIREIQKEIATVVTTMSAGAEKVTEGLTVVAEGGDALKEIQLASDEVANQVQEISKSFESQADQAGKVVEAITNIVAVSEENASATQEISASTEELTASMESMVAAARQLEGVAQRLKAASANFKD